MQHALQLKELINRKEIVKSFFASVVAGRIDEAYDRYVSPDFTHHNQYFPGDRQSLKRAMKEEHDKNPMKTFQVRLALEDGEYVATHSFLKQNLADPGAAVVHIFRFRGDMIVELWELGQPVQLGSPNKNGMF
jgi:predicted SnoaL-like aldol condensation-catalyzing enzyme